MENRLFRPIGGLTALFLLVLHATPPLWAEPDRLTQKLDATLSSAETSYPDRLAAPNRKAPRLRALVESVRAEISDNPYYQELADRDLGFNALRIQVLNQLLHVSFDFKTDNVTYPHAQVIDGPYPVVPTLVALAKARDFFRIAYAEADLAVERGAPDPDREKALLDQQNDFARRVTRNSFQMYADMSDRLRENINAPFVEELMPVIEYLQLKIRSDEKLVTLATYNVHFRRFRQIALDALEKIRVAGAPYLDSVEAIERALEFYDVYYRAIDPQRSPTLYHSGRYLYYNHFLKAAAPDHILLPTLSSLGATDILRTRGVPIGFVGVNTEITWVDGYYQTPFEFYIHDINHSRRMWQFFLELAQEKKMSIRELAKESDDFVKNTLMPLISIHKSMTDDEKNHRRLIKILLFEILHEDALPALREVIERAVLREADVLTPFETIVDGRTVHYIMEPGATTLRYVFRKLAHDFYDMPGDRVDNIVAPEYRTEENIVKAAETLFGALNLDVDIQKFVELASTDQGLPGDFRMTVERDFLRRLGETKPLVDTSRLVGLAVRELLKHPQYGYRFDGKRAPVFRRFMPDHGILKVHMTIPIVGGEDVDVVVGVDPERLGVNPSLGTVRQVRGSHRIIELRTAGKVSHSTIETELLSQLAGGDYLLVLQAHEPGANQIVASANRLGIKTMLLADVNNSRGASDASPTYFAVLPNQEEVDSMWDQLVETEGRIDHLRLDFTGSDRPNIRRRLAEFELSRRHTRGRLEDLLIRDRNVRPATLSEIAQGIGRGKTPVYVSGAMLNSWELLNPQQKDDVRQTAHRLIDSLDPETTYLITSGFDAGSEGEFHRAAQLRGIDVIAAITESTDPSTVGKTMTRAAIVSNTWSGKSRPVLEHVKEQNGLVVFVAGGDIVREEIKMAEDMGVNHIAMKGPVGAGDELATRNPHRGFATANEAMAILYHSNRGMIRAEYRRPARDALYSRISRYLQKQGVQEVSYRELLEKAEGRKVVILGGFVGLGYQDTAKLREAVKQQMIHNGDGVLYVGVGTYQGIGLSNDWIPQIAADLGFKDIKTAGIVSRNSVSLGLAKQDYIHFVDGDVENWKNQDADGVFVDVRLSEDTGGRHVFFNGGAISAETAKQALGRGLPVEVMIGDAVAPNAEALARQAVFQPNAAKEGLMATVEPMLGTRGLTFTRCTKELVEAAKKTKRK